MAQPPNQGGRAPPPMRPLPPGMSGRSLTRPPGQPMGRPLPPGMTDGPPAQSPGSQSQQSPSQPVGGFRTLPIPGAGQFPPRNQSIAVMGGSKPAPRWRAGDGVSGPPARAPPAPPGSSPGGAPPSPATGQGPAMPMRPPPPNAMGGVSVGVGRGGPPRTGSWAPTMSMSRGLPPPPITGSPQTNAVPVQQTATVSSPNIGQSAGNVAALTQSLQNAMRGTQQFASPRGMVPNNVMYGRGPALSVGSASAPPVRRPPQPPNVTPETAPPGTHTQPPQPYGTPPAMPRGLPPPIASTSSPGFGGRGITSALPVPRQQTPGASPSSVGVNGANSTPSSSTALPAQPPVRKAPPPPPVFTATPATVLSGLEGESGSGSGTAGASFDDGEGEERIDADTPEERLPKEKWLPYIIRRHPDILELRERLAPLCGRSPFSRLKGAAKTEVKEVLSRDVLIQLIMAYFNGNKLHHAAETLREETAFGVLVPITLPIEEITTAIPSLLKMGAKDVERVFDLEALKGVSDDVGVEVDSEVLAMGPRRVEEEEDEDEERAGVAIETPDKPLWTELLDGSLCVIFEAGENGDEIKAASLNRLVERLTSEKLHDLKFMQLFLRTYQSFCKPELLLKKLIQRYHVPRIDKMDLEDWKNTLQRPIQLRVCNVLNKWIERQFFDFNEKTLQQLNAFVDSTLSRESANANLAKQLRNSINKRIVSQQVNEEEKVYDRIKSPSNSDQFIEPKVPKNIFAPDLSFYDVDDEEIARQMTLVDSTLFADVQPGGLLNRAWLNPGLAHRALSVKAVLDRMDDIRNWVFATIVKESTLKNRVKAMSKFVKICDHLRSLHNYSSVLVVMDVLGKPELRPVRDGLEKRVLDLCIELDRVADPEANFRTYREALENCTPPCVPYLPNYLNELKTIDEQEADFVDSLINFVKRRKLHRVIEEILNFQGVPYGYLPVYQIQKYLTDVKRVSDAELTRMANDVK